MDGKAGRVITVIIQTYTISINEPLGGVGGLMERLRRRTDMKKNSTEGQLYVYHQTNDLSRDVKECQYFLKLHTLLVLTHCCRGDGGWRSVQLFGVTRTEERYVISHLSR